MESHCTGLCPIVAEAIHRVVVGLGAASHKVAVLAISTDPEGDTLASVRRFSQQHGMLHSWHYLVASRKVLTAVWNAYFIYAAPKGSSPTADQQHTSATYLLDPRGRERVLLGGAFDTETLNRDVRILSGLSIGLLRSSIPAPEVGHLAPLFSLASLSGSPISLRSLRGKVVLVNFWATWCGPCKSEMPRLAGWYGRLRARGFVVLGVDQLEGAGTVRAFVQKLGIPYPVVLDQNGDAAAQYDVVGTPTSYLVDRQGYVEDVTPGILDKGYLNAHIEPLLGAGNDR
jgi:cytochrome oxidase Cu insertion factor (SCO1/SenC/PrrC family)